MVPFVTLYHFEPLRAGIVRKTNLTLVGAPHVGREAAHDEISAALFRTQSAGFLSANPNRAVETVSRVMRLGSALPLK